MSSPSSLLPHAENVEEEDEGHVPTAGERALTESVGGARARATASTTPRPAPTPSSSPAPAPTRPTTTPSGWMSFWGARGGARSGGEAASIVDAVRPIWDVTDDGPGLDDAERRLIDLATTRELRERQLAETIALEAQRYDLVADMGHREHWRLLEEEEAHLRRLDDVTRATLPRRPTTRDESAHGTVRQQEETPSPGAPPLDVRDLHRQGYYSAVNAYAAGAPVAPMDRPTDANQHAESLEELLRKSRLNVQLGTMSDDIVNVVNAFNNEKGRGNAVAKATAAKLATGSVPGWAYFEGPKADCSKHMPEWCKGLLHPSTSFDPNGIGRLLQVREVLNVNLANAIGIDSLLLGGQIAQVPVLCVHTTADKSVKIYNAIINDRRSSSSGRLGEGFATVILALRTSLKEFPTVAGSVEGVMQGLSQPDQIRGLLLQIAESVTAGWRKRGHITDLVAPFLEKERDGGREAFTNYLAGVSSMLRSITDLGLPVDLDGQRAGDSFRERMRMWHKNNSQVTVLLVIEDPSIITGTGKIDILEVLQRGARLETLVNGPSKSVEHRRPGIKPTRDEGTMLLLKEDKNYTREEWAALSPSAKQAQNAEDKKRKTRLSFKLDSKGDRINEVYCTRDKVAGCGWVAAASIKEHNAKCPLRQGGATGARRDQKAGKRTETGVVVTKGKCYNCGEPGHFGRDCPQGKNTATLLATLSSQIAQLSSTGHVTAPPTVPCAAPAASAPSSSPATMTGRRALFASAAAAADVSASATALAGALHLHHVGNTMLMTLAQTPGHSYGYGAEEDVSRWDSISIDPLGLGTWAPSIPLRAETASALPNLDTSRVRLPRNAWLTTTATVTSGTNASDDPPIDIMRALADFEQSGISERGVYSPDNVDFVTSLLTGMAGSNDIYCKDYSDVERARIALGVPPFKNHAERVAFMKKYGIVIDGGANVHAVNTRALAGNVHEEHFSVSTVGASISTSQAGTLCAHALSLDCTTTVRLPQVKVIINEGSSHSILGIGAVKSSTSSIDSCTDPTRLQISEGVVPWMSVGGEHLLVVEFESLLYIIVQPLNDKCKTMLNTMSFSTSLESFESSVGAPSFDNIVRDSAGANLRAAGIARHDDAALTTYITGAGFTLTGEDAFEDIEAGARVETVHDALFSYGDTALHRVRCVGGSSLVASGHMNESAWTDTMYASSPGIMTTVDSGRLLATTRARAAAETPPIAGNDYADESVVGEESFLVDLDATVVPDDDDDGAPPLLDVNLDVNDWSDSEYSGDESEDEYAPPGASRRGQGPGRMPRYGMRETDNAEDGDEAAQGPVDDDGADDEADDQRTRARRRRARDVGQDGTRLRITKVSINEWHNIFGHANVATIRATLRARGFRAFDDYPDAPFHCDTCAVANARKVHRGGLLGIQYDMVISEPGQLVCIDVLHLAPVESLTGIDKALICIDRASGFGIVAPYTLNSGGPARYQLGGVITRCALEIRRMSKYPGVMGLHSDLALDEINTFTEENLTAIGAIQFGGAPYHSNTNPNAEVTIRIVRNRARAFAVQGGIPPQFAFILMLQAMAVQNDLVGRDGKSPRQRITGAPKPYACVFDKTPGQLAFAYKAPNRSKSKQDTRGHAVMYLGRGSLVRQVGFACWDPVAMCVFVSPSVRFPRIPFGDTRFPYFEGLVVAALARARNELSKQAGRVQPYDAGLPNGMIASELMGRKVKAKRESGRGFDLGEVTTCRYIAQGLGDELLFGVKWKKVGDGREVWYNYEELGGILVDDSGIEMLVNLALAAPEEAEAMMADATSFNTLLHTARHNVAKRHDNKKERSTRGRINETTWTDITFALRDAKSEAERQRWRTALHKEITRMFDELEVFDWTALQKGDIGPMTLSMPCKIKLLGDLHADTESVYKVRCVGGTSKKEIERRFGEPAGGWESFAATIAHYDLLHLLAVCVEEGMSLYSLDVEAAYLHAEMPRDNIVYRPPSEYPAPDPTKPYLRAKRALYGWAESSRAWFKHLLSILGKLGFKAVDRNSTWFFRRTDGGLLILGTVVDDVLVGSSCDAEWLRFLKEMRSHVPVDAGPLETFIGVSCSYDKERGVLKLNQTHLIKTAMGRFGVNEDCRKYLTPMECNARVTTDDSPQVPDADNVLLMQKLLGTLQYIALTRPDIKMSINLLARVASNPSPKHVEMGMRVLMYLVHTREIPLVFSRGPWFTPDGLKIEQGQIVVYVDASFADSPIELKLKSRTGYALMRAGAVFCSKSGLQSIQSGSSCQAEVIALYAASVEAQAALQNLIRLEMPHVGPVLMMEDNSAAISVMSASGTSTGSNSRHFLVKFFYTAELCADGTLKLVKVGTNDQLADGFTKPLLVSTHARHRHFLLGLHALTSEELKALGLDDFAPAPVPP